MLMLIVNKIILFVYFVIFLNSYSIFGFYAAIVHL